MRNDQQLAGGADTPIFRVADEKMQAVLELQEGRSTGGGGRVISQAGNEHVGKLCDAIEDKNARRNLAQKLAPFVQCKSSLLRVVVVHEKEDGHANEAETNEN